jgi:hypothetical protein
MYSLLWFVNIEGAIGLTVEYVKGWIVGWKGGRRKNGRSDENTFDVPTSNISFIRVPKTEKCDVTASNGTHQSANSRRGHMS